jgi:iron(III) transport system substrate-binding protein
MKKTNKRSLSLIAIAVALLSACANENPQASTSGQEESAKELTIYSGRSESLVAPLFEQFTAQTGIQVEVRYGDSAEMSATILEEGANSPADVFFSQDAGALGALTQAGLFKSLPMSTLEKVDPAYRATDGTWVGVSGRARVFDYNPELVTDLPNSVLDLADPQWKDRIAIAPTNASFQSFVTAMRVELGEDATQEFLTSLAANAVIYEKNGQILDAVEAGEVAAGLINHYYWYEKAAEIGAAKMKSKLAWFTQSDTGNLVNVAGVGVLSDNEAAITFVDWLLGENAQKFFLTKTFEYALTESTKPDESLPTLAEIGGPKIDLSDLATLAQTQALLREAGLIP